MSDTADCEVVFTRHYEDDDHRVAFVIDRWFAKHLGGEERYRTHVTLRGRGNMDGARALVAMFDESVAEFGTDKRVSSIVDLSEVRSSPLRAQMLLGRWLLTHKKLVTRIAVFGGAAWEMSLARAVMKIAGMDRVGFFATRAEALAFLAW